MRLIELLPFAKRDIQKGLVSYVSRVITLTRLTCLDYWRINENAYATAASYLILKFIEIPSTVLTFRGSSYRFLGRSRIMYLFLDSISISKITLFVNVIRRGTFRLFRFGFNCGSRLFHKQTEMTNF